ncbi:MAG: hypothetical protein KDB04_15245 [Acidimicrobiales bacterium]|nr:hypothetical protein [Acidimicrobiales bacterium]
MVDAAAGPPLFVLEEYRQVDGCALPEAVAHQLRRAAGTALSVQRSDRPSEWTLKAGSVVGTISVPGARVLIKPKVDAANLFHLLGVSSTIVTRLDASFSYARQPDLVESLGALFAEMVEQALAKGIVRRYVQVSDDLQTIRGRVSIQGQVRRGGLPLPVTCTFDEHTADIGLNRIVKAAVVALAPLTSSARIRARLATLAGRLEEVGPLRPKDLAEEVAFTRLDRHMEAVERLGRLILDGSSLRDDVGGVGASVFLVDMNRLFEEFIEERLRAELRHQLEVTGQRRVGLDDERRVGMRPDLVFSKARLPVFVGDAKYKLTTSGLGRDRDYYQLLAYCTSLGLDEGVLVYCRDDGDVPPTVVKVRNVDVQLHARAITLAGTPAEVDAEVRRLATWVLERVQARGSSSSVPAA